MWDYGGHMAWMGLWWLGGLALLVAIIWAVMRAAAPSAPAADQDSPESILKRRYARGDLDREEYERRLSDLRK